MQKTEIIVDPQVEEPSNRTILDLAKHFHVNGIQMREKLMKGFSFESGIVNIDEYAELFKHFDITYRIVNPIDPRTKYHYYKKCKYPYSSIVKSPFQELDAMDRLYSMFNDIYLTVPADRSKRFFQARKEVYDHLSDECFSYSAPTSMGKSFVMRMFIKAQIVSGIKMNFALIVPTKALINEVRSEIIKKDLAAISIFPLTRQSVYVLPSAQTIH